MNTTQKETLPAPERFGELVRIGVMVLIFGFFAFHQVTRTGFFTVRFGWFEMVCLYGPILLALVAPTIRALTGYKNPARPFEAATNLFLAAAAVWFLSVFPFDFSHLGDVFPGVFHLFFSWIGDWVGRFIFIMQAIVGTLTAVGVTWRFITYREQPVPPSERQAA